MEELSDFTGVRRVTGPLGTIGWDREKCASSSLFLGLGVLTCCALFLENFPPCADDAFFLLVIKASRRGVDSDLEESVIFA